VLTRLALGLLGAYVAVLGMVVHRQRAELLGVEWPWGLALAIGVAVVAAVAAGHVRRMGESWFMLGWVLVVLAQAAAPGGSYLVAADWLGWTFTLLGMGCLGLVVVWNSRLGR
jgi:hypothetical protein